MSRRVPKSRTPMKPKIINKVTVTRYRTQRYEMFEFFPENRVLYEGQIRKMLIDLQAAGGWHADMPMKVVKQGTRLFILDGQHRYEAAKRLGIPIWYEIVTDAALTPQAFNADQKAWALVDYVTSYRGGGNDIYEKLEAFRNQYGLGTSKAAALLMGYCGASSRANNRVKDGSFAVADEEYAIKVGSLVQAITQFFPYAKRTGSVVALSRFALVEQFEPETLVEQCRKYNGQLHPCGTMPQYSKMYEDVYNFRRRGSRLPLKFLADEAANGRNAAIRKTG